MKDGSLICCKYLIHNSLVVQGISHRKVVLWVWGSNLAGCNIFRSPNFLGISNIFVKVVIFHSFILHMYRENKNLVGPSVGC
jgi:hypothetical protein